jgi:hypothetical protein
MSLLDKASLIVTPNAYKESKLYSVIPTSGAGDMTVVRATTATRKNSAGFIEVVPRNLLTDSDGLIATYPVRGGNIIQASTPISGFNNSVEFQNNLTTSFLYKSFATTSGTTYVISVFVQMNDNSAPVASLNTASGDFSFIMSGEFGTNLNTQRIGTSNVYRISARVTSINTNMNYGILKSNTQSSKAFKVTGYQLEFGTTATDYFPTTTRLNMPRIDYTNGSCPSLLVEPQRTNIILNSQNFAAVSWTPVATTITANAGISPDGTNNANKFIPSTLATSHYIAQLFTSSTSGSISIYAKADGYNNITLLTSNTNVNYNLSTGTVQAVGGVGTGAIQSVGNGWYRCILYKVLTTETLYISCGSNTNAGFFNGSGNGTSGVLIWGAQVEVGAYPTSYIPTVASTVTRNADVISKTGISSLIGQTEGTIFIDFNVNNLTSQTADPVIFSTSGTNYIRLSVARVISYFESNTVSIVSASNVIINGRNKIAVNYKNNDFSLYVNGVLVGSNNSGAVVAKSNFALNYLPTSIFDPSLFYNSIQLYKTKLTNAESIAITTI